MWGFWPYGSRNMKGICLLVPFLAFRDLVAVATRTSHADPTPHVSNPRHSAAVAAGSPHAPPLAYRTTAESRHGTHARIWGMQYIAAVTVAGLC